MGHSIVAIDGNGFQTKDHWLELWLRMLALHLQPLLPRAWDEATERELRLHELRDIWLLYTDQPQNGCVMAAEERIVEHDDVRCAVLEAARLVLEKLRASGPVIDRARLDFVIRDHGWLRDPPTEPVIRVGEAFVRLLEGEADGFEHV